VLHAVQHVQRTRDRKPAAVLADFVDSAIALDIFRYTTDPWRHPQLEGEFRFAMLEAFERLNIVIAFPSSTCL
jgi:small-conductance mechanosensitive channel